MKKIILILNILMVFLMGGASVAFADAMDFDVKEAGYYVYVATPDGGLNIRYGPGTEYDKVMAGRIPDGVKLYIGSVSGNWGYTSYNGYEGWVALKQTTTPPPVQTTPKPTPAPTPKTETVYVDTHIYPDQDPAEKGDKNNIEVDNKVYSDQDPAEKENQNIPVDTNVYSDQDPAEREDNIEEEEIETTKTPELENDFEESERVVKKAMLSQIILIGMLVFFVIIISVLIIVIINLKPKR